jgi:hypothetical protein
MGTTLSRSVPALTKRRCGLTVRGGAVESMGGPGLIEVQIWTRY